MKMVCSKSIRGSVCLNKTYFFVSLFLLVGLMPIATLKAQSGGTTVVVEDVQFKLTPEGDEDVEVSPNPASDQLTIRPHPNVEVSQLEIFGSDGMLIFSRTIQNGDVFTVDLALGIYYFKIHTDDTIYTKTIIIH